jgi:uncharacterized membrane protein
MSDDSFICPVCGAEVPAKAKACPECGSDENTGWSHNTIYDGTGVEDPDDFDYKDWHRREVKGRDTSQWWWLAVILVLAAAVRLFHLGDRVVWFDESLSLLFAKAGVADLIKVSQADAQPPFYQLLLHLWMHISTAEYFLRLLSVLAGVATVGVVFGIGSRLAGRTAGLWSAALMALAPLHVWYSQELRMYAVQTLLVCLSWWFLLRMLDRCGWKEVVGYAVVTALSLYTQYTSALSVLAQNVFILVCFRAAWKKWGVAQAVTLALFLPGMFLLVKAIGGKNFGFWMAPFSWMDPLRFFALFSGAIQKNPGAYWPFVTLSLVLAVAAAWKSRSTATMLLLWLLLPVAVLAGLSLHSNMFLPRAILFVAPAFALLIGIAAARGWKWIAFVLVAGNLFALQNYFFTDNFRVTTWIWSPLREMSRQIAGEFREGDVVLHSSRFSYRPFQFYLGDRVKQGMTDPRPEPSLVVDLIGTGRAPDEMMRVWLVLQPDFQNPRQHVELLQQIRTNYRQVKVLHESPQLFVALYEPAVP